MIVYGSGALARSRVFDNGAWPASAFAACVVVLATPIAVAVGANGWTVYCLDALSEIAIVARNMVIVYHENTYMLKPDAKEDALSLGIISGTMIAFVRGICTVGLIRGDFLSTLPSIGALTFSLGLVLPTFLMAVFVRDLEEMDARRKNGLLASVLVSGMILRAAATGLYYLPISGLSPAVMPALLVVGTVLVAQTLMMHPSFKIVT